MWCFPHSIPAMALRRLSEEMALSPRHCFLSVSVHGNLGQFLFSCVVISEVHLPGGKVWPLTSRRTGRWIVYCLQAGHFWCSGDCTALHSWKCLQLLMLCKIQGRKSSLSYPPCLFMLLSSFPEPFPSVMLQYWWWQRDILLCPPLNARVCWKQQQDISGNQIQSEKSKSMPGIFIWK